MTRLNDPVRCSDGTVSTINELAAQGLVRFTVSNRFYGPRTKNPRVAYFAEMPDGGCWEISKYAYNSACARHAKETNLCGTTCVNDAVRQ
jgi:hypothetical protein